MGMVVDIVDIEVMLMVVFVVAVVVVVVVVDSMGMDRVGVVAYTCTFYGAI